MKKVLIVDDEPNILMSLEFLMKKQGYKVFIARDGHEALDIIRQETPDLIILDIMMPEVDGYEVCRHIRESNEFSQTRIVFLSAKSKSSEIEKGYQIGADLYITKPFSTRNLVKSIQELLLDPAA
ncbi:MAG: response regulator [Microscillaceae bacterium]|nr:response regulator [Microscillaceae bacterium]